LQSIANLGTSTATLGEVGGSPDKGGGDVFQRFFTRRRLTLLAGVFALVLVAAACGDDDDDQAPAAEEEGAAPSGDPIRIGTSLPLTGDFSEPGQAAQEGYEVWEALVNDGEGLLGRPVEIVVRDDASEQNLVVTDYTNLISQENVDLLLGTFSSFLNLPASAVAERNQMVYVCPACGAPEIFERGFSFYFFSQQATADNQGNLFAEWVTGLPEGERPQSAAYVTLDDPFAAPVIEGLQEQLEAAGVETVFDEIYPPDTRNFDTIANSISSRNPDLVAQGAIFEDGVGLVRSFIKVGFSPSAFFQTTAPSLGSQYAEGIGAGNTEGIFFAISWDEKLETPMNAEFVGKYEEMFGGEPAEDAADAFASAQVLQAAVEEVGSIDDQEALADYLHNNGVETILGPLRWDEAGRPQGEFLLAQWQGGGFEIVRPEEIATGGEILHPKPEWGGN
jgi:branched-chain amino acid transport system substrate-binding protein